MPGLINFAISPSLGNRPRFFLENTSSPSNSTSKTPPEEAISSDSIPKALFNSSARPAALGL